MSFVFIAILKSISPVKPPVISLFLSNLFIFEMSMPFNKMLLGVVSEIVLQLVPLKVFHVVLLSNDIKSLPNQYGNIPTIIKVYDLNTGLIETLDTNNFKNIPVDKFEKIKVLYTNPDGTYINCLLSFDNKTTWKTFNGTSWNTISDTTPSNILLNGMDISKVNKLDKNKLIAGGFTGDIDFRIAMKTNDNTVTPSITKIYILYC